MRLITHLILLFIFITPVLAESPTYVMPKELIDIANSLNCEQVTDFYNNRPGMIEPPFAYGALSGERENSAVFWCRSKNAPNSYKLVLVSRKNFREKWKHEIIFETKNYPDGLSILEGLKISLDNFQYTADPKKRGPNNVLPSSKVILSYYDGVAEYFYNYNGHWLIYIQH